VVNPINQRLSDRNLEEKGPTEVLINRELVPVVKKLRAGFNELISSLSVLGGVALSAGTSLASSGTVSFSNANGVSFGLNGQTLTASVAAGGGGGTVSAGTASVALGQVVFSNSNNLSFGLNGSTITGSASFAQSTQPGIQSIFAGTTRVTTGEVSFSNVNGISFGANGQTITASYTVPAIPAAGSISAGTTSATLGQVVFSNSNGLAFGMNAGTVTGSYTVPTVPGAVALAGGTQTATSGTVVFSNSNGVTFGMSGSTRMTASVDGIKSISAGTTRVTNNEAVFSNSNGISFGANGQTITGSHNGLSAMKFSISDNNESDFGSVLGSQLNFFQISASHQNLTGMSGEGQRFLMKASTAASVISISMGVRPFAIGSWSNAANYSGTNAGALMFRNSNGVSWSLSADTDNSGVIVVNASIAGGGVAGSISAGTTSVALGQAVFSNSNGVSFGLNGSTVTASVTTPSLSAGVSSGGNTSGSTGLVSNRLVFAGGNNITLSQSTGGASSATITISADGPLHSVTWEPYKPAASATSQHGNASLIFAPFLVDGRVVATQMRQFASFTVSSSSNSSHGGSLSMGFGIYTKNVSTLSLMFSGSTSFAWTNTSGDSTSVLNGIRAVTASFGQTTLTGGDYWIGVWSRSSTVNANWWTGSNVYLSGLSQQFSGNFLAATNSTNQMLLGQGVYTATTSGAPASVAFSQIHAGSAANQHKIPYFQLNGATV
jgi:hypothetical protein